MSRVLTNEQNYYDIANTIRQMKNVNTTYKPREMASALKDIYSNEVEGTLPLSFEANGNFLLDYRIDGASGGVGDRTGNLVDKTKFVYGYRLSNIGTLYTTPSEQNLFAVSEFIEVNSGEQYIISQRDATRGYARRISFYQSKNENSWLSNNDDSDLIFTIPNTATYLRFTTLQNYIDSIMLIRGTSLPTTYEPYGYKVPVVVNGKNLFDETQVPDKSASTETSNYQIFKQNGKLIVNGMTVSNQVDTEISKTNGVNNQALDFINNNAGNYIFTSSVPGRIMIRYKLNGSDVVRYTFDEYNSSNRVADRIVFRLQQNYQYDNETMNIMFKLKQIQSDNYEPYHEPITTNIYLDNPIRTINDEVEYIDYSEQKQHRVRKNLLQNTATSRTINGVTCTVNDDKSVTFIGSPERSFDLIFNNSLILNPGTYIYTNGLTQSDSRIRVDMYVAGTGGNINYWANPSVTFTTTNTYKFVSRIFIQGNAGELAGLTIYPMLRESSITDDTYEPYIENTEVDVTLPAIPTLDGTNTLSIDTTIQPSNVYVQAPKDSIEATMIANALEEI